MSGVCSEKAGSPMVGAWERHGLTTARRSPGPSATGHAGPACRRATVSRPSSALIIDPGADLPPGSPRSRSNALSRGKFDPPTTQLRAHAAGASQGAIATSAAACFDEIARRPRLRRALAVAARRGCFVTVEPRHRQVLRHFHAGWAEGPSPHQGNRAAEARRW